MTKGKQWIVTTSGDKPLKDLRKALTKQGFAVSQVLDEIGCIVGTATEDVAAKVRKVPGVTDVSPDTPVDIGPPGSDLTW